MAWFKRNKKNINTDTLEKKDIPQGLWYKCPKCKNRIPQNEHRDNLKVCACGHHDRYSPKEYFDLFFDTPRYKLLFENLTANRSYVLHAFKADKNKLKNVAKLSELKNAFTDYIDHLEIEMLDMKEEKITKFQQKTLKESAWLQLIITMKFWMDDSSKGFEKTDIFIEKAVNTSFDLIDTQPLKSIIDLGKFLYKEKMKM